MLELKPNASTAEIGVGRLRHLMIIEGEGEGREGHRERPGGMVTSVHSLVLSLSFWNGQPPSRN